MNFNRAETAACRQLVKLALDEDLDGVGDLTSKTLLSVAVRGCAVFVARTAGVLAGFEAIPLHLTELEPRLAFHQLLEGGMELAAGDRIATIEGPMVSVLVTERTGLNFLQRLSGI